MILKFRAFLDRGGCIDIGWVYSYDVGKLIKISHNRKYEIDAKYKEWQSYNALPKLHELKFCYPYQFKLKLLGNHAKSWVCDRKLAYLGSHNVLSSNIPKLNTCHPYLASDEMGTLLKSPRNITKVIQWFENKPDLSTKPRQVLQQLSLSPPKLSGVGGIYCSGGVWQYIPTPPVNYLLSAVRH